MHRGIYTNVEEINDEIITKFNTGQGGKVM